MVAAKAIEKVIQIFAENPNDNIINIFFETVDLDTANTKCSQLGGRMPLPKNAKSLKNIFLNYNSTMFESVCDNRLWIPIRRSPKNLTSWESLSGEKVSISTNAFKGQRVIDQFNIQK